MSHVRNRSSFFPISIYRHVAVAMLFGATICAAVRVAADEPATVDYLREVKPLLKAHCLECHGARKQESGLRLDTAARARAGGDSGPAIVPGKSAESRLVQAVRGVKDVSRMPPEDKPALTEPQIAILARWIDAGAQAPADEREETHSVDHWAFKTPVRPALPATNRRDWSRSPLDTFVLAKLETQQVAPSPEAERAVLLRRVSLDLLGLPPSLELRETFLADEGPDAYERLTDLLLAHPAYGERWGRHWLDQARYADSNGYTRDFGREIWPFRDWVLRAINHDLPFDQFTSEQLAGDLLPNATLDQRVATGFHRNTLINEEGGTDQEQFRVEAVADRVATTGQVWLGLTLGCARCHNHKYDPVSQREFYEIFAVLNNCDEPSIEAPTQLNVERRDLDKRAEIRGRIAELEKQIEQRREELEASQRAWEKTVTPEQRARLPGPIQIAYDMPFEKRDAANKKTIEDYYKQSEHARQAFPVLDEIAKLRASEPKIPQTMVLRERAEPRATHVHKRGDFLNLGVAVQPGVPAILHPRRDAAAPLDRLGFARWLTDPANPLTPRVTVNRYWQALFGRGLVETDDDFGLQGTSPTHPELMNWLAREFADGPSELAWSQKRLLRLVVTSAVYRQSSQFRSELESVDPRNEWLARQNRLRVEAEIVRDVALGASGLLTRQIGGPSVMPPQPEGVYAFTQDPKPWKAEEGANRFRRGMYTFFWRSLPYPMLTVFDAPNANVTCTRRIRSNTPLQALTLANDTAFVECSQALAARVLRESPSDDASARARLAFAICLTREPSTDESQRLHAFVEQQRQHFTADPEAARHATGGLVAKTSGGAEVSPAEFATWTAVSRVLLNLDEFITRE